MTLPGNGPFQPGDHFLKYEIGRLLGKGGHAFVYEATHLFLRRVDAIKIIPPPREFGRDLARRAEAEAQVLARLEHENIVKVYDAGGTPEGLVYIVMERLTGRTLRDAMKELGRLAPAEALLIAEQVASAVEAAHQQGVIHRDLKPENVFLVGGNAVKVLDFGIAKVLEHGAPTTQKDLLHGTVLYMSPEQLQAQRVTPRSDIFSLGTMLFEALHRHPALLGEMPTLQELGWIQIARMPPPLSQLDAAIPRFIARFVQRAIMKSPEQRYASMAELAEAARTARERHTREVQASTRSAPIVRDLSGSAEGPKRHDWTRTSYEEPRARPVTAISATPVPARTRLRAPRELGSGRAQRRTWNIAIAAALVGLTGGSGHALFGWWSDVQARDHSVPASQPSAFSAKTQPTTERAVKPERTSFAAAPAPPSHATASAAAPAPAAPSAELPSLANQTPAPSMDKRASQPRPRPAPKKQKDDHTPWLGDPDVTASRPSRQPPGGSR
jgi:serine/threonine protein kinase